jgi:hypothetical protein
MVPWEVKRYRTVVAIRGKEYLVGLVKPSAFFGQNRDSMLFKIVPTMAMI